MAKKTKQPEVTVEDEPVKLPKYKTTSMRFTCACGVTVIIETDNTALRRDKCLNCLNSK